MTPPKSHNGAPSSSSESSSGAQLFPGLQRVLNSTEHPSKVLVDVCGLLGLSLDDLYDVSLNGWNKPLAHRSNEPRCLWAMNWILHRLSKVEDETAETFRKDPLAWNVMYYLIKVLSPTKTQSYLGIYKFPNSLLMALVSLSEQETSTKTRSRDGSIDVTDIQSFRDSPDAEDPLCLSTVISCDQSYHVRPGRLDRHTDSEASESLDGHDFEKQIRCSLGHRAFASISQVLRLLQSTYINEDQPFYARLSVTQGLFRGDDAIETTRLLSASMVVFDKLIAMYGALVDRSKYKTNIDMDLLAPFIELWRSESDFKQTADVEKTHLLFLQTGLDTSLRLKSGLLPFQGEGARAASRDLDKVLRSTLLRLFRDSFIGKDKVGIEDSEKAKFMHEAVRNCLKPVTLDTALSNGISTDQSGRRRGYAYLALPDLFELACTISSRVERSKAHWSQETLWLMAFLRRLIYGLGVDVEVPNPITITTTFEITHSHKKTFTDLLRVASRFDIRLDDENISRCMGFFATPGNVDEMNWAVVRACVTNRPEIVFLNPGAAAITYASVLSTRLCEVSAVAAHDRTLNGSLPEEEAYVALQKPKPTCDNLIRGFVLPLLDLFVERRRLSDFFAFWRDAVTERAVDCAADYEAGFRYCLLTDERLLDAISRGVRDEFSLIALQAAIDKCLSDVTKESAQPCSFASILQLDCLVNSLCDEPKTDNVHDNLRRLELIREVLGRLATTCMSKSFVDPIFQWRLWRTLDRTAEAALRARENLTSLFDICILAKAARKNVSKAFKEVSCSFAVRQKCLFSLRCLLVLFQLDVPDKNHANKCVEKELLRAVDAIQQFIDQCESALPLDWETQKKRKQSGPGVLDVLDPSATCLLALLVILFSGVKLPHQSLQTKNIIDFICSKLETTKRDRATRLGFQWALQMLACDRVLRNDSDAGKALRQGLLDHLVRLKKSDNEADQDQTIQLMNIFFDALIRTGVQSSHPHERTTLLRTIRESKMIQELMGSMSEDQRLPYESLRLTLTHREPSFWEKAMLRSLQRTNDTPIESGTTKQDNPTPPKDVVSNPVEFVREVTHLLRQMTPADVIEIRVVIPRLKSLKITVEDRTENVRNAMHTLLATAMDMMRDTQLTKHFIIASQIVWILLSQQVWTPTQYDIDSVLACVTMRTSETGIKLPAESAQAVFTCMTRVLGAILSSHVAKVGGRYHLLVHALQGLLRCLFTQYEGRTVKIEQPSWLTGSPKDSLPDAACAESLTRIITSICDPTVAAARGGSSRRAIELNDPTKKAKSLAGQSMQFVVIEYCRCQLRGSLKPDVRARLEPGIYSMLNAMSRETHPRMMASMTLSELAVYRPLYDTWNAARKS